jgi:uncharacterized protein YjdB
MNIQYEVFMSNSGWLGWVADGQETGFPNGNEHIEAFRVQLLNALAGVSLVYGARLQDIGWQGHVTSAGRVVGSTTQHKRVDGLKVMLLDADGIPPVSVRYKVFLPGGWTGEKINGAAIGLVGKEIQAMTIRLA